MENQAKWIQNTAELAVLFDVSERQIQRLVEGGVIEPIDGKKSFRFALEIVVPQYISFLLSGASISKWAHDA